MCVAFFASIFGMKGRTGGSRCSGKAAKLAETWNGTWKLLVIIISLTPPSAKMSRCLMGKSRSKFASSLVAERVLDTHSDLTSCFSEMNELSHGISLIGVYWVHWFISTREEAEVQWWTHSKTVLCAHAVHRVWMCLQSSSPTLEDWQTCSL